MLGGIFVCDTTFAIESHLSTILHTQKRNAPNWKRFLANRCGIVERTDGSKPCGWFFPRNYVAISEYCSSEPRLAQTVFGTHRIEHRELSPVCSSSNHVARWTQSANGKTRYREYRNSTRTHLEYTRTFNNAVANSTIA